MLWHRLMLNESDWLFWAFMSREFLDGMSDHHDGILDHDKIGAWFGC